MSKKAFHIYNIIFLLILLSFNALALFGGGMSQGGIGFELWFAVGVSFIIFFILYAVQMIRPQKGWRLGWFIVMVVFLLFWETGLGVSVGCLIDGC